MTGARPSAVAPRPTDTRIAGSFPVRRSARSWIVMVPVPQEASFNADPGSSLAAEKSLR
jgi:hypothetical protein